MCEPLTIQARSGDAAFMRMIRHARFRGAVHSVFDRAVNLQCAASGDLYTLAAAGMDDAPNTLVIETAGFRSADARIGVGDDAVAAGSNLVIGGKVAVTLVNATEWRMRTPLRCCSDEELRQRLALVRAHIAANGVAGGMLADPDGSVVARVTSEMLASGADLLVAALAREDLPAALNHTAQLIGLGPGLTPSGDDFLVGVLGALATGRPLPAALEGFCAAVAELSKAATNAISHAAIRTAAAGELRASVAGLLASLRGDEDADPCSALGPVLGIGSCSGTDIAWGIVRGLDVILTIGEHAHGTESHH